MALNDLAHRVLEKVQGDKEAIKKLSEALVSRDPVRIRNVFSTVAKVDLSEQEVLGILGELGSDPERAVAYVT